MNVSLGRLAGILLLALVLAGLLEAAAERARAHGGRRHAAEHALKHTNPKYRCPMHPRHRPRRAGQLPDLRHDAGQGRAAAGSGAAPRCRGHAAVLPQSDGSQSSLAGAGEGRDGHGLRAGLRRGRRRRGAHLAGGHEQPRACARNRCVTGSLPRAQRGRRLRAVRRAQGAAGAPARRRLGRRTVGARDGRDGAGRATAVHAVFADARERAAGIPRCAQDRQPRPDRCVARPAARARTRCGHGRARSRSPVVPPAGCRSTRRSPASSPSSRRAKARC